MPTNYVLIDFENVQPKNLEILSNHTFVVIVFVGANQSKIPFDLANALQRFGENAKYIKTGGAGKNSLDFHLAFYLGELASKDPDAYFHIISKDTGFDPLIAHLKQRKVRVMRERDLAEIPLLQIANATSKDEKIAAIVKNLASRGTTRPRKLKTLANTINSLFLKKLEEKELMGLVDEMQSRNYIRIDEGKVSYTLPQ